MLNASKWESNKTSQALPIPRQVVIYVIRSALLAVWQSQFESWAVVGLGIVYTTVWQLSTEEMSDEPAATIEVTLPMLQSDIQAVLRHVSHLPVSTCCAETELAGPAGRRLRCMLPNVIKEVGVVRGRVCRCY